MFSLNEIQKEIEMVRYKRVTVSYYNSLDGPIEQVIQDLSAKQEKYTEEGFVNIVIQTDGSSFNLVGDRPETKEEEASRIMRRAVKKLSVRKLELKKEAREREDYEKLKKKFENK